MNGKNNQNNPNPPAQQPVVSDSVKANAGPFHLDFSDDFQIWMKENSISMAFSTYTLGKVVMVGPGTNGNVSACERNFGRAMSLMPMENGFALSTLFHVWSFYHSLPDGKTFNNEWDKLYIPRQMHITGNVDVHDIHKTKDKTLYAAITAYNCIAKLDEQGSFTPFWKPKFIDDYVAEDRCHLNGFCLENDEVAYVSVVGKSNVAAGWRDHRKDGGLIIDARNDEVICEGLSMPHTPRLYNDKLWVLEAGAGWFGWVDVKTKKFNRVFWCPGFLRGLRFYKNYALIGLSLPRNNVFSGLPLDDELKQRETHPVCAIYVIDLDKEKLVHHLVIRGSVSEIYDILIFEDTLQPMLIGLEGEEIQRFVYLGGQ